MKQTTLGDICEFRYGKSLPSKKRVDGAYAVYGSNGCVGSHIEAITGEPAIIVGRKGSIGELHYSYRPCWPIDTTYYIDSTSSEADLRWLYHAMRSLRFYELNKATGVPGLNRYDAYQKKMFVPNKDEQRRIASILDKADGIRRKREEAITMSDRLLRAAFLKIFGDPTINPHGFAFERITSHLIERRTGTQSGPFGSALKKREYVEDGIPVWGVDNVQQNRFVNVPKLFITEDKFEQLKRYKVMTDDVLISRAGTVGRMCIAKPTVEKSIISTNLVRVVLNNDSLLPEYFVSLFTYLSHRLGALKANNKSNAFTFLNPKTLRALEIPIPPMELQMEFKTVTEEVEEHLALSRGQLGGLDELFESLSKRSVHGAL